MENLTGLEALGLIAKNEIVLHPVSNIKYKLSECGSKIMCASRDSDDWHESACQGIYWACTEDRFELISKYDMNFREALAYLLDNISPDPHVEVDEDFDWDSDEVKNTEVEDEKGVRYIMRPTGLYCGKLGDKYNRSQAPCNHLLPLKFKKLR